MDLSQRTKGFQSIVRRFPIGAISMVAPFNFPLNLAAHKIAPAMAVGCVLCQAGPFRHLGASFGSRSGLP